MKGLMMDVPLTIYSILDYGNRVFPDKEVVSILPENKRHRYTFHDLYLRSKKLADALVNQLGVQPGDRIGTFAWNHFQHLELYYAIPGAAAICHTLNIRLSTEQINFIVNDAEDSIIFVDSSLVHLLEKIAPHLTTVRYFVLLNAPENFRTTLPNLVDYEELMATGSEDFSWKEVDENDGCAMCYTSGTTGHPKGVLYSHRSTYLHTITALGANVFGLRCDDRILVIVPMFHAMAWGLPFCAVLAGTEIVFPSSHLHSEPLAAMLEQEAPTIACGVPTIWIGVFDELQKHPPAVPLALREFFCGGSALPKSLMEGFEKKFGIHGIHLWGMTEISPLGTCSRLQPKHKDLTESGRLAIRAKQGFEVPGVEIKLMDENGQAVPRDGQTMGEIWIRGPWVAATYFKLAKGSPQFSSDGWFKTGDVASIDMDGYMHILDRTKDLIKSGGEWISSVALELALMGHPQIKEACVIAIPDPKWVERPMACIIPRDGASISNEELREFLCKDFAHYQIPDQFVVVKEIPRTSVGKFNKVELRRRYSAQELV